MEKKINDLLLEYSSELKKLREEKETSRNQNFYYLDGRIASLELIISDLLSLDLNK